MTNDFLVEADRLLTNRRIERHRLIDGLGRRPGATDDFHQRDHMRRIEGVTDDTPFGVLARGLHHRHGQTRGARGDNRIDRRSLIEVSEQLDLEVRTLRAVFLNEICIGHSLLHVGGEFEILSRRVLGQA